MAVDCFRIFPRWRWLGLSRVWLLVGLVSGAATTNAWATVEKSGGQGQKPCPLSLTRQLTQAELPLCDRANQAPITATPILSTNAIAQTTPFPPVTETPEPVTIAESSVQQVDVDPAIIEGSPVLQRWLEDVPNLAVDIPHDPAFRTRMRVGYAEFPSTDNTSGVYVGVQDVFVGRTPLTLSAEYAANGRGDRRTIGADAQYYLLPLGWYGNLAPVVGYRDIQTSAFASAGVNLGLRVIFIPSRTGTADLSITQTWVAPGSDEEVGLTTFAAGYAIAEDWRIGTDVQIQNTRDRQESRVGILLEWML